jgi:formate C-acetyltransferase
MKPLFYMNVDNNNCDFDRIDRMRARMHARKAYICSQRALLYTESFKQSENDPYIIRKAKAFAHTLRNMDVYIEEDSLIFGNMGYKNFAAPIFPEFSIDWVIKELDEFEKREGDERGCRT